LTNCSFPSNTTQLTSVANIVDILPTLWISLLGDNIAGKSFDFFQFWIYHDILKLSWYIGNISPKNWQYWLSQEYFYLFCIFLLSLKRKSRGLRTKGLLLYFPIMRLEGGFFLRCLKIEKKKIFVFFKFVDIFLNVVDKWFSKPSVIYCWRNVWNIAMNTKKHRP